MVRLLPEGLPLFLAVLHYITLVQDSVESGVLDNISPSF